MKFGNTTIGGMSFGSTRIGGAKYGNTLVFQSGSGPTPPPYIEVEYIESDGTAYIDTGIKGNAPMSAKISVTPATIESGNTYPFGVRKDSGNTRFFFLTLNADKKAGFGYGSANTVNALNVAASFNNRTPVIFQTSLKAGSQKFYAKQDGESSYASATGSASGTVTTGMNIFLFTYNYIGSPSTTSNISGFRVQWCSIYSDDNFTTLVRHFIPCYYNGEYGMWDLVSDTFFGNAASSGAFTGPSIQ